MYASKYRHHRIAVLALTAVLAAFAGSSAIAQDKVQSKTQAQDRLQDPIYGSQLMADAERNEYRLHTVSYTHLRAHETVLDLVCRLLLEKKKQA